MGILLSLESEVLNSGDPRFMYIVNVRNGIPKVIIIEDHISVCGLFSSSTILQNLLYLTSRWG